MAYIRPFLKWAGSKYNCLSQILSALPPALRLIEPFTGSGAVFMNADYSFYLMAESNLDLIQIFTILKKEGASFIDYCQQYFVPENNCKERYYLLREAFNTQEDLKDRAALFLYLNKHGFNGLCRYNSKGIYNVPIGHYKKPYFPRDEMLRFLNKSQHAEFIHADFRETFALATPGDVIYCDPPYVAVSEKTPLFSYTQKRFEEEDQIALAQLAQETAARGIPVILSNHDTAFTRHHYQNANIKSFPVARLINCQGDLRHPVKELVAVFMN